MLATAADIVADPSAPDAFVQGIMEGKDWVWMEVSSAEQLLKKLRQHDQYISQTQRVNLNKNLLMSYVQQLPGSKVSVIYK